MKLACFSVFFAVRRVDRCRGESEDPFMLKWTVVKVKSQPKPEFREAAAATTLAAAHKSRCMRRALSQVSNGSWRLGVEGSLAEMGLMKLTSARARAQRVIEVRENRARVFESGVQVILTAMKSGLISERG